VRVNRAVQSGNVVRPKPQQPTQGTNTVRVNGQSRVVTGPSVNVATRTRTVDDNAATFRRRTEDNAGRDAPGSVLRRRVETRREAPGVTRTRRSYPPARYGYPSGHPYGYGTGYRYGYWDGYSWGYHLGYGRGFYIGYTDGYYYWHRHWYGPHLVFGYHYGGFGFYRGYWHFAIVIGNPYVVHHYPYDYAWWDGRGASLVTWDRMVDAYPADYVFGDGSCVALWVRTTDGIDYTIKIDPSYYNAHNPGELYIALWAELDEYGSLQIQDIYGATHVFPASMIQQIEATPCR
jgi:hypothetical protein